MEIKTDEEYSEIDSRGGLSSLVLPYLEYLYKLFLDPFIKKYDLKIGIEFWFFLTLAIFSFVLYVVGISIYIPISFFVGALLIFILNNSSYLRRKFFPKQKEKIESFLKGINKKKLSQILSFMKSNSLNTDQIIKMLKTKHKEHYEIYKFILQKQTISQELLKYIVLNNLETYMGEKLFIKYLFKCRNSLSKKDFVFMKEKFKRNKKISKAINLCYYFHLPKHPLFKLFASIRNNILLSIDYGSTIAFLFLISLSFTIYSVFDTIKRELMNKNIFSTIFATLLTSLLLTALLKWLILLLLKVYTKILHIFSPKED